MQGRGGLSMMKTMDAELRGSAATVQLVHFCLPEPVDEIVRDRDTNAYRIDLCLTPRPRGARACYRDRWGSDRFERIGHVYILPPGEILRARSDGGHQTSLLCHLRPEPIRAWFDGDLQWSEHQLDASLDVPNANIRGLLLRLAEEVRHPGFGSQLLVELIAVQLAIELSRYCAVIEEGAANAGLAPWRLRLIDERLREVRAAPQLAELAGLCRLSVRQLTRGFRASRGCSIGDYVAQRQADHAKRLLGTDETVKTVAHSLGFSSPSAFAHAFRRITGESPREFRERVSRSG